MITYIARQLAIPPDVFSPSEVVHAHTRTHHLQTLQAYLGYRRVHQEDLESLAAWLGARALEHDKPLLLYELLCEKLRAEQLLRPGITRLERLVAEARQQAQGETFRRLTPLLTDACRQFLDTLLQPDPVRGMTPLAWLRRPAVSNAPRAILDHLHKLAFLRTAGIERWQLDMLNPNRLKLLAQVARRSSSQALQRAPLERRYPLLVAFVYHCLIQVTDDILDMFDRCLADANARAEKDLKDFRATVARATNDKVHLFRTLGQTILDPTIPDAALRTTIYQRIPPPVLQRALQEVERIIRPLDDSYVDFFATRYSYLRQFTPTLLATLMFQSNRTPDALLEALTLLRDLNTAHWRLVPDEAPLDFVPMKWRPYVVAPDGSIRRHYYELCVFWELRGALRGGNVWVQPSRRYANPESYLIPKDQWMVLRPEVCQQVRAPVQGAIRLKWLRVLTIPITHCSV